MLPAEATLHLISASFWVPDNLEPFLNGTFSNKEHMNLINTQHVLVQVTRAVPVLLYEPQDIFVSILPGQYNLIT